ncbi:unnamed protein product [Pieris brassicae]|uniref:RING-type domain-containing protein n=1 Tax=Pieris brassicae TaxID=7116 RepID=A0A9P0XBS4_PIEBR|nr:unnamed protein product [Pieris brassicae]
MPVTLMDRLPLPNLKVYSAGSVLLLSIAVYYSVNVTSDPNWRTNATLQKQQDVHMEAADMDGARNLTEQMMEVMTFMIQEPLCMWTLINMSWCLLAVGGWAVVRAVFGRLRVSEAQRAKDKLWNYVFYKFIFVFGVLNVHYLDELLLWCAWFTLLGALTLLTQLAKDRFEYLSSSPTSSSWAHGRLVALLAGELIAGATLMAVAVRWGLPAGRDTFAFMAAECVIAMVPCVHVVARFVLRARGVDTAGSAAYYTHLVFDAVGLVAETGHVAHMVVHSNAVVSMASMVLLMQLRHLLHALLARLKRHRLYAALAHHMSRNYPMASPEEVEKNQDNCAICWEPMKEARKLPCAHLFHNSCLCRWVQQDASCPTCRRSLSARPTPPPATLTPLSPLNPLNPLTHIGSDPPAANHLFHFDGSRYVSWLPSFSVEVTRVPAPAIATPAPQTNTPLSPQLDAIIAQVSAVFPQYSAAAVRADVSRTRSAHLTIENILEGRLPTPPSPPTENARPINLEPAVTAPESVAELHSAESAEAEFSESAAEREMALKRRKMQLLDAARRRYLQRLSPNITEHGMMS